VKPQPWPGGLPVTQVRVARPTDNLDEVVRFYATDLGLPELDRFCGHAVVLAPATARLTARRPADDVRIEPYAGPRNDLRSMFELAEDSPTELDSYLHAGRVLVARSGEDVLGHLQLLGFYQRQGFRFRSVERDAFGPATGYPPGLEIDGIALRDRVWLDRTVGPGDTSPARP
jgi:YycE-like N-terminal domain